MLAAFCNAFSTLLNRGFVVLALGMGFFVAPAMAQSLPNGGHVSGAISFAGEQDSYTLTATAGENVYLRVVDTANGSLTPRIDVYRPNGSYVTYGQGTLVGAAGFDADVTGTYTVVVRDASSGNDATGAYKLYYTKVPGANEHGALPNGGHLSETIDLGDLDSYTLTATAGENVYLRVVDTANGSLTPRIDVYRPNGSYVTYGQGTLVGAAGFDADVTGTYTVVVRDASSGSDATGAYRLYYTKAAGANEHGALPNGGHLSETIDLGDLDSYTLTATAGENVYLRVVDTANGSLVPRIDVYRPNGSYVTYGQGTLVGAASFTANATGTYTVVVRDASSGSDATGAYRLYYTKVPGANEHGALPNGGHLSETIDLGDLDSYTLTATAGENVYLRVVDTANGSLTPRIDVYRPNGSYVTYGQGTLVGAAGFDADVTGTYTVVVRDASSGSDATGAYRLYYTKVPGANEHGALPNGGHLSETIDLGDLDSYTLTATAGENVYLRVVDTANGSLVPRIDVYRPNGSYVTYGQGTLVGAAGFTADATGTYTVVVRDASSGSDATGAYRLYYTKVPGANEHGRLYDGVARTEQIDLGDLDSYTFTAKVGNTIQLRITDTSSGTLYPRIQLYRPNGSYITYAQSDSEATLSHVAAVEGTYTVVVFDASSGSDATGTYQLVLTGAGGSPGPGDGGEGSAGGDGDVPLPLWSLVLFAGMLLRGAIVRKRSNH